MKQLHTQKERSRVRGGQKASQRSKSHHCHRQGTDMKPLHCCHLSRCQYLMRRKAIITNIAPDPQELSIITDARLIRHQGLFNHEVKSTDIERFSTKKKKRDKPGKQAQQPTHSTPSHSLFASHISSPSISTDCLDSDAGEVVHFKKKPDTNAEASTSCWEKHKKIPVSSSPGSDIMSRQSPESKHFVSIGSCKSSLDAEPLQSKGNILTSGRDRGSQLINTCERQDRKKPREKGNWQMLSSSSKAPETLEFNVQQTKSNTCLSPLWLTDSVTGRADDNGDIQNRDDDLDCVTASVNDVAERLHSVHLPLPNGRNLVEDSRIVLLKALYEVHWPKLQRNLLKLQQRSFSPKGPTKTQHQLQRPVNEEGLWSAAPRSSLATENTTDRESSSLPQRKTTCWPTSLTDIYVSPLEDVFGSSSSPLFRMDFEPLAAISGYPSPSPSASLGIEAAAPKRWEKGFKPKCRESIMFDSTKNHLLNHTSVAGIMNIPQCIQNSTQHLFPQQAVLSPHRSAKARKYQHKCDSFATENVFFPHVFSPETHQCGQIGQRHSPPNNPPISSYPSYMMHSHTLGEGSGAFFNSILSPKEWSFPPMRLYQ